MDDKVFNLLEKMYLELTEFKQEVTQKFDSMDSKFNKVDSRLTKIEITLENSIKPNTKMALEELVSVKEKQIEHDARFDSLESKIESHDVEISVIKRIK